MRSEEMKPAVGPGDLELIFKRMSRDGAPFSPRVLSQDPWVVVLEDFLSDAEVDVLIRKGGHHFERSLAGDGITPVRTSSTSWCNVDLCLNDPVVQAVRARIADLIGISWENAEHLQLLRYLPGEFYKAHHDQNALADSAWGTRVLTFFMYLSNVDIGGQTRFNNLGIEVTPRKGSALIWPNVLVSSPDEADNRTFHEAVAVEKGTKLSANFWVHRYNFQHFLERRCENRQYVHLHHLNDLLSD